LQNEYFKFVRKLLIDKQQSFEVKQKNKTKGFAPFKD
jgi:hypothetical protein